MNLKYLIKIVSIPVLVIMIMSMVCFPLPVNTFAAQKVPEGYEIIAQSKNLILYYNSKLSAIAVQDTENGYIWRSIVDGGEYDLKNVNEQWKANMSSLLTINYVDKNADRMDVKKVGSGSGKTDKKANYIKDGLSVLFNFKEADISVLLEITLEDDNLVVRIPADKIQENGNNLLVFIELMPFFGAADRTVDGYLLYPDGSGCITRYANADKKPGDMKTFSWNVYGSKQVNIREDAIMQRDQKYQAMLPVYGIKNGDNAVLAAACEGEEDADITLNLEGYAVNLNRIFFSFNYRHFYSLNLSNITVKGKNTAKTPVGTKIDNNLIMKDREVRIFFLNGKAANYSGMANIYRDYLIKNGLLNKVIKDTDNIPIGLDLFMGIKEERLLFDKFIPMTTFENAVTISEEFKNEGVENLQVMFKGWTKGGYGMNPVNWPPERKLGGSSGLKAYSEYAASNGIKLYLQNNFTQANVKNGGFSPRKDVVMQGNNLPVTNQDKNSFLINPFKALERLKGFLKELTGFDKTGIAYENIGRIIYHDYNKSNPSSRSETAGLWEEMLEASVKTQVPAAVEGGNQYILKHAARLYNLPVKSSEYVITDESVPFLQMVIHGMIPYTSEPGNLSYDLVKHKLKWIEYGCMPYFELTYQKSVKLKNTDYNRLFTSYYKDWYKQAADIYKEFNSRLKPVWNRNMTGHEKIREGIYRIKYDNGTIIYINYNENDEECESYRVKAQDYLVIEKGGRVK